MKYLNGRMMRNALLAGTERLMRERKHLNEINVFPVADADTGTNMAETMKSIAGALIAIDRTDLTYTLEAAADSALNGAKGNSGAIMAQFFTGLATELKDTVKITVSTFADAVEKAVKNAYLAVTDPKEGTILSVLKAWSVEIGKLKETDDFIILHRKALKKAKEALQKTKYQLAQLKKANVVDAGAQGFVNILEGIEEFILSGKLSTSGQYQLNIKLSEQDQALIIENHDHDEETLYRYCTEVLMDETTLNREQLKIELKELGDSLIIAGINEKFKIHIHTDRPAEVINRMSGKGNIIKTKIDDMKRQMKAARSQNAQCAIVVDSACDMPIEVMDQLGIQMIHTRIQLEEKSYIDKLELSSKHLFEKLQNNSDIFATTSQPPLTDFNRTFSLLAEHYDHIQYIGVSGSTSGTLQAGIKASSMIPNCEIEVINARLGTIGIGIIAKQVAEKAATGISATELSDYTAKLVEKVEMFVAVPDISYLIRGGRMEKNKGKILNTLKIRPIVARTKEGNIGIAGLFIGKKGALSAILRKTATAIKKSKNQEYEFMISHAANIEMASELKKQIEKKYNPKRTITVTEMGASLSLHAGPGAVAISFLPTPKIKGGKNE